VQKIFQVMVEAKRELADLSKVVEKDKENYIGFVIAQPSKKEDVMFEELNKLNK